MHDDTMNQSIAYWKEHRVRGLCAHVKDLNFAREPCQMSQPFREMLGCPDQDLGCAARVAPSREVQHAGLQGHS